MAFQIEPRPQEVSPLFRQFAEEWKKGLDLFAATEAERMCETSLARVVVGHRKLDGDIMAWLNGVSSKAQALLKVGDPLVNRAFNEGAAVAGEMIRFEVLLDAEIPRNHPNWEPTAPGMRIAADEIRALITGISQNHEPTYPFTRDTNSSPMRWTSRPSGVKTRNLRPRWRPQLSAGSG